MKRFPINLHRSGTRSMTTLLRRYGSVLQYPEEVRGVDYESQVIDRERDLDFVVELLAPVPPDPRALQTAFPPLSQLQIRSLTEEPL